VKEADERAAARKEKFKEQEAWPELDLSRQAILISANVSMCVCCYVMQFYATSCFSAFELREGEIDNALDGDWTKFLSTLGWCMIALFGLSCLLLTVFNRLVANTINGGAVGGPSESVDDNPERAPQHINSGTRI